MNDRKILLELERLDGLVSRSENSTTANVFELEGPVCAGKTTLLDQLVIDGAQGIEEYSEYVSSASRTFPTFPPKDDTEAKQNFEFFLKIEKKRSEDYIRIKNSIPTIVDRGVFTLLCFEAAVSPISNFDLLPWAIDQILLQRELLIIPNHIIYLDIDFAIAQRRAHLARLDIRPLFLSPEFNENFRSFFILLRTVFPDFVTIVDSSETQQKVFRKVRQCIL